MPAESSLSDEPNEELLLELDGPAAEVPLPPGAVASQPAAADVDVLAAPPTCRLDVGGATSRGLVRRRNEDSYLVQHLSWSNLDHQRELALIVVADGMGGYDAGDRASDLTIRTIGAELAPVLQRTLAGELLPPAVLA